MKKLFCLLLCAATVFSLYACSGTAAEPTETTEPKPTQSPEEQQVEKILIFGNSHSGDTFWQLQEVFDAHYEGQVRLGYLYYSGCTIAQHVKFSSNNEPVYAYRTITNGEDQWTEVKEATMDYALKDQQWDVIVLQGAGADRKKDQYNLTDRRTLEAYVEKYVAQPFTFVWHSTWANPNDGPVFAPDWPVQPPAGCVDNLKVSYGWDAKVQFSGAISALNDYIRTDDTYTKVISSGTAIMQAVFVQERPQTEIYRDYTHLTDFARLMASYAFFTQYTGQRVAEIKIDVIPACLRQARFQSQGDLVITDEMKAIILEAINYAMDEPFRVPTK